MRMKGMIIHSSISKMENKILPTCLEGNYRDSLGEFSKTSYSVFGAERVKYLDMQLSAVEMYSGWGSCQNVMYANVSGYSFS